MDGERGVDALQQNELRPVRGPAEGGGDAREGGLPTAARKGQVYGGFGGRGRQRQRQSQAPGHCRGGCGPGPRSERRWRGPLRVVVC